MCVYIYMPPALQLPPHLGVRHAVTVRPLHVELDARPFASVSLHLILLVLYEVPTPFSSLVVPPVCLEWSTEVVRCLYGK